MKQATVVRLFLLGLPIGLVVTSVASMIWHFSRPQEKGAPRVFTTLSEEITEAGLLGFVNNLAGVIGPRHESMPGTLERAANYIESTLGERNIGFQVARQEFAVNETTQHNLWVEIPGGKRRNECVVAVAHYDAPRGQSGRNDNASSVAALLALAENFIGEKPTLTIRLAFLTNGTAPHIGTSQSGAHHFAQLLKRQGDRVRAVICLDSIGAYPSVHPAFPDAISPYLPAKGPFLSLLGLEDSISLLNEAARQLSSSLTLTVQQGVPLGDASALFQQHDAGPFQATGFPTLLLGGNGMFFAEDLPVDGRQLTSVSRSLATLIRVLSNPGQSAG